MKCPFCGDSAVERFRRVDSFVWKCTSTECGLEFLDPQPTEEQLSAAYSSLYYPDSNGKQRVSFENTPVEVLEQAFDHLTAKLGELKGLELLDYGCGKGRLCGVASSRGMLVTGIEASATARIEAERSGIPAFGTLEDLTVSQPDARYDLITIWDVIEHLRAPWRDLSSLKKMLKPGGRLLVSTMNTRSLRARIEGSKWENYSNPTHIFFFDRQSLRSMISRSGFLTAEEWILPIQYPQHGLLRRLLQRCLIATSLNSEMVFLSTNDDTSEAMTLSDSLQGVAD
jgi:2-polyprenyl-3-methyl-5-hydroxy-6-metoxy-1,4-benzoquinol methylase